MMGYRGAPESHLLCRLTKPWCESQSFCGNPLQVVLLIPDLLPGFDLLRGWAGQHNPPTLPPSCLSSQHLSHSEAAGFWFSLCISTIMLSPSDGCCLCCYYCGHYHLCFIKPPSIKHCLGWKGNRIVSPCEDVHASVCWDACVCMRLCAYGSVKIRLHKLAGPSGDPASWLLSSQQAVLQPCLLSWSLPFCSLPGRLGRTKTTHLPLLAGSLSRSPEDSCVSALRN